MQVELCSRKCYFLCEVSSTGNGNVSVQAISIIDCYCIARGQVLNISHCLRPFWLPRLKEGEKK